MNFIAFIATSSLRKSLLISSRKGFFDCVTLADEADLTIMLVAVLGASFTFMFQNLCDRLIKYF
jgi:hypothetical protein